MNDTSFHQKVARERRFSTNDDKTIEEEKKSVDQPE